MRSRAELSSSTEKRGPAALFLSPNSSARFCFLVEPVMSNAVKILKQDDQTAVVGGYGVVFHGADLVGETFTPETEFGHDDYPNKLLLYDHDPRKRLGAVKTTSIRMDEVGLWVEGEIEKSRRYAKEVLDLVERGILGWSSGTATHLADIAGGVIKSWPIIEFSLTPTPAEPRTLGVERLKALAEIDPAYAPLLIDVDQDDQEAASKTATVDTATDKDEPQITEIIIMSDEKTAAAVESPAPGSGEVDELRGQVKTLTGSVAQIADAVSALLENAKRAPALKDGGYIAPDSETDRPEVKSFGDWLIAVKNGNTRRLASVYKSVKDMTEGVGNQGGYLVPEDFVPRLMQLGDESAGLVGRVTNQPVSTASGKYPALDVYLTPTAGAGNTAFASGVTADSVAEGGTFTETQATIEEFTFTIHKVGDVVEVTNELIADSAIAIETLLTNLFRIAINNKLEHYVLRGTGAGEPLGVLNASAAIGITPASDNAFGEADALSMLSRFKPAGGNPVWVMHRGVIPDFNSFTASNIDAVDWRSGVTPTLLGYPILYSEHAPQDDNAGNVILMDPSAYLLFTRQGLTIDFSEHAAFSSDKGTWRFKVRVDGQPWLRNAITLADPQGSYTVSPFVYHND